MGDNQDDGYAGRRAELNELFDALPLAGESEYWRLIEGTDARQALPLEVLARCCRERYAAIAVVEGDRIFEVMLRHIQRPMNIWAWRIARQAHGDAQSQLKEDLEQECHIGLWKELTDEGPTFLLENFAHALTRLQQHVAHDVMEKAGEWQRPGISTPTRVPRREIDSLQIEPASEDEDQISDNLADPAAEQAFERADLSDMVQLVRTLAPEHRDVVLDRFWRGALQEEIAAKRNITSKTVYNRLKAALGQLGVRYAGDEEHQRV